MSKVLILSAGVYRIPLIRRALNAGHHVVVASWSEKDPGMRLGHESCSIDTTHKEELLHRAIESGIEAVTTTGTDVAVPSIGWICDHMHLPGFSYDTAVKCSNKVLMQDAFSKHNVRTAAYRLIKDAKSAYEAALSIGYPVIVKAPDSSGSRGVIAVDTQKELRGAFAEALGVSRCGEVLVEKLLRGEEFGGQIIVYGGEIIASIFHNDTVTPPPICVPIGHSCPCRLSSEVQREAEEVCARAGRALGISKAVCNADLILTQDGVYILEVGTRIGATGRSGYSFRKLFSLAFNMLTGYSTLSLRIASVVGFLTSLFGLTLFLYVVIRRILQATYVPGFAFVSSEIALFAGLQVICNWSYW